MNNFFERLARYYLRIVNRKKIFSILEKGDFSRVNNDKIPIPIKSVAFVLPTIAPYSGGTTSVLRLGTALVEAGYHVTYLSIKKLSIDILKSNASVNLKHYQGDVEIFDENQEFDLVVATAWETAYFAKKLTGYKMYFVQDFEPLFCDSGEIYSLAQQTYNLGFHMVSLGEWNKMMIVNSISSDIKIDTIEFPYEKTEYTLEERDYKSYSQKKCLILVVYLKPAERRLPNIIQYILKEAKEKFYHNGIELRIIVFGGIKKLIYELGENKGQLSKIELQKLYKEADFGLVSSMTNISLVPYEMLATGLPLIEFSAGSYSYFLGEDTATLIDFSGTDLYNKIIELIRCPTKLVSNNDNAQKKLRELSWDKTSRQFVDIIKKLEHMDER